MRGFPCVLVMAFHRSPLVSFPKKHVGLNIFFSFSVFCHLYTSSPSSHLVSALRRGAACGQPFLAPAHAGINRHAKNAAPDTATPVPCQVLPWTPSAPLAGLGRHPGLLPQSTAPATWLRLLQLCIKIHVYSQQTTPAASAFAKQHLRVHGCKVSLTKPPCQVTPNHSSFV